MMLDDVEECQLSGPIGELMPFTWARVFHAGPVDHQERAEAVPIFFPARVEDGRLKVPRLPEGRR